MSGDPNAMAQFYGSRYSGSLFDVTFNEDSSLATGAGWDDVTGVGAPYAPAFVAALSQSPDPGPPGRCAGRAGIMYP